VAEGQKAAARAEGERRRYTSLFEDLPIAAITTHRWGEIVDVNPVAATLLNLSARHAAGRSLLLFFEPRTEWMEVCRRLTTSDERLVRAVRVRPREKAPQRMVAHVRLVDGSLARWFLLPATG
jgi:PAS domain S-box-containing protein